MFPLRLLAVGFGEETVYSYLGQPLDIRVPLLLAEGEALQQKDMQLASPREYRELEQLIPGNYSDLQVDQKTDHQQQAFVHITSSQAMDEAMLVIILRAKRGRGFFYKKLRVLLDSPPHGEAAQQPLLNKDVKQPGSQRQAFKAGADKASLTTWARRDSYGPVQRKDSLSVIAYRLRKDKRWSNRQIMLALYDKNPTAFHDKNINRLKTGSYFVVPTDAEVANFLQSARMPVIARSLVSQRRTTAQKREPEPVAKIDELSDRYFINEPLVAEKRVRALPAEREVEHLGATRAPVEEVKERVAREPVATGDRSPQTVVSAQLGDDRTDDVPPDDDHSEGGSAAGWISFVLLLLLNIGFVIWYKYRNLLSQWLKKGVEDDIQPQQADSAIHANEEEGLLEEEEVMQEPVVLQQETDFEELPEPKDHVQAFEEAIQEQDWAKAELCYAKMSKKESRSPRTQALLIKKMHEEGDMIGRNIILLNLSHAFDEAEWHRFCSLIDVDLWHQLQDENIVSYTGKVIEKELSSVNQGLHSHESDNSAANIESHELVDEPDILQKAPAEANKVHDLETVELEPSAYRVGESAEENESPAKSAKVMVHDLDTVDLTPVDESEDSSESESDMAEEDITVSEEDFSSDSLIVEDDDSAFEFSRLEPDAVDEETHQDINDDEDSKWTL